MDLTRVDSDPIFYYNIGANQILTKSAERYTIQNLDTQLNFYYLLWKIDANKYLIAGENITISFEDGTEKNIDGYLEIEYYDNQVIKLYNQEITYQTISEETIIHIPGDIEINLATKMVRKNDENQMNFENMVIDSDDNITIVDLTEKEDEDENEMENQIDNTQTGTQGGSTQNSGGSSEENNQQNSGTGGSIPTINGDGTGNIDEIIDNNVSTIQLPKFKTNEFNVTTTGVTTNISITDEEGLLKDDTNIKILRSDTGKVVYETTYPLGEYEIALDVQSLVPDTEYILQVESAYEVEGITYQKNFMYKQFKTNITGISFEKDVFTNKTMSFSVNFEENSQIARAEMVVIDANGQEIQSQIVTNTNVITGSKVNVEFQGLEANTNYEVKLTNVLYNGQILVNGFDISKNYMTLKDIPNISGAEFEINKRDGNFKLKLNNVQDTHSGIQSYRYEIYDAREQDENQTTIKTIETNEREVILPIDDTIVRNVTYVYKVVAIFNDNEKICEYESEYSELMRMDGAQFPTVSFEEEKVTFERIEGALVIEDNDHTIELDEDTIFTITYTDSVGKTETFTAQGSLRIPVRINNLRANETYKFAIYGRVDLKDGNDPIDQCYIGGAFVKTKEPENLVANYSTNNQDTKNTFNVNFKLTAENPNSEQLEAQTLTGMEFKIYSGQTIEGDVPQGVLIKSTKVVDTNIEPYESTLKETYYDSSVQITPEFFGAENSDFREEYYTITVSNAYDYTDYQNELPIINYMCVVKTNGYMPDIGDAENASSITVIRNYETDEPNPDLSSNTVVGYRVKAKYDNSGGYAKTITYRAINEVTGQEVEVIELPIGEDGNIPEATFHVGFGTPYAEVDASGLKRGNEYYFTYEVMLDLNKDRIPETTFPPEVDGEEVTLRSETVRPEKEQASIIMYPASSTETARTYQYQLKDVDHSLTSNEMVAYIQNRIVDRQNIQETSGNFSNIIFSNLNTGNLKITVRQAKLKTQSEEEITLIEEYFESSNSIRNLRYSVSLDTNRIVISLEDTNGNRDDISNLEKVAAFQVLLDAVDGTQHYETELKTLSSTNTISVNFNDIGELIGKETKVTLKAYYDSGKVGYEMESDYIVLQKAYLQGEEKYYYILNREGALVENNRTIGHMYYRKQTTTPNELSIINAVYSRYQNNITLQYSEKGMLYEYGVVLPKKVEEAEITCVGDNIIEFDIIIPGISMLDENGEMAITPELDRITMKPRLIKDENAKIKDNKIYIDIYETDENGANTVLIKTIEKQTEDFNEAIIIDGLSPKSYYGMRMRTVLEVENAQTGLTEEIERYLYDVDYEMLGRLYYFSTLTDVGIDDIQVIYSPVTYQNKMLNITYTIQRTMGYDLIQYRLEKYNETTQEYEEIGLSIEEDRIFNKSMTKNVAVNPGSPIDFGEKYKLTITPIAHIETVAGEEIELELGEKEYEFNLRELAEPTIAIKGNRVSSDDESHAEWRVTIYDADRMIVGDSYKVKILDDKRNDITPESIKNQTYSVDVINNRIIMENIDIKQRYTLQVIVELDYENKNTNIKEMIKEYSIPPVNEYGITIGNVIALTNSTNEAKIDLRFADSYKLEEIDDIMYSVYDTEGYSSTKTVEFIPQVIMSGEERYYMFTLDEVISREGKYYIEIQFFKQDETEGNIMIDATSIEYVYLRGN